MEVCKRNTVYPGQSMGSIGRSMGSIGGSDVMEFIQQSYLNRGVCQTTPLSSKGKRLQLIQMLCLNIIPILGLWGYTIYRLADSVEYKDEIYERRDSLHFSIDLGKLVHRLQVERDMSVFYLSSIGPNTKAFLLDEYTKTDDMVAKLSWPRGLDNKSRLNGSFLSKKNFETYLLEHRQNLKANVATIMGEIEFYSLSVETIIQWLYDAITESKFSLVWKMLVAYQKLSSAKENLGVERALGTMFFARGGFDTPFYFNEYNQRLNSFRSYMKSIGLYSDVVGEIYLEYNNRLPMNLLDNIEDFRFEIQTFVQNQSVPNIEKAGVFFDNMTIYLDMLLDVQNHMASYVISTFTSEIDRITRDLAINIVLLIIVILMFPVIIKATESLTSSIQAYTLTLVDKTKELRNEKKKTDGLLYQMVPKPVADLLKRKQSVDAEYFKMVTVSFSDIYEFDTLTVDLTPLQVVNLLNTLYNTIDNILDEFDVYKVETINDSYMVASGLPKRNGERHATEISSFALTIMRIVSEMYFLSGNRKISLRIGINSGPCMAGVVGSIMPRYCLFGDTVNTASRMKSYSDMNKIHISHSTYALIKKSMRFTTKKRGSVNVKGKGAMDTYWLMGNIEEFRKSELEPDFEDIMRTSTEEDTPTISITVPPAIPDKQNMVIM